MALVRRIRSRGRSAVITLPKQVLEMLDLKVGDSLSFELTGRDLMLLKVVRRQD